MTTASSGTPAIDLLTLLSRYESLRSSADADLRSSIWNITKARRGGSYQGGGSGTGAAYSADDVREDLRARALLEWRDTSEPGLVDEEPSSGDDGVDDGPGSGGGFVLHLDGMEAARLRDAKRRSPSERSAAAASSEGDENVGLRRRRGGNSATDPKGGNEWTAEESDSDVVEDEEERLRNADPLNLFGVPPPALREAQAKSRSAVAYYVEVANLAREIVELTASPSRE